MEYTCILAILLASLGVAVGFRIGEQANSLHQRKPLGSYGFKITNFKWSSCGSPDDLVEVKSLGMSEDGKLSGDLVAKQKLEAPVKVTAAIQKKLLFWVPLPKKVWENFCDQLAAQPACPAAFVAAGIPCLCPFEQGNYQFDALELDLPIFDTVFGLLPDWILSGDIKGKIEIAVGGVPAACLNLSAKLDN